MANLELNKIAAALLLATLITTLVGVVANILYKPKLEVVRGYQVHVTETATNAGDATQQQPGEINIDTINIEDLMAKANITMGGQNVKKCLACHNINKGGGTKIGPDLWGIINSPKGKNPNFTYSKAMSAAGGIWDLKSLFHFLHKPGEYVPGTKMTFPGFKNPQDIADVIAYLKANAT